MGSEKYPDENEYDKYLEENGGFSNAFTDFVRPFVCSLFKLMMMGV